MVGGVVKIRVPNYIKLLAGPCYSSFRFILDKMNIKQPILGCGMYNKYINVYVFVLRKSSWFAFVETWSSQAETRIKGSGWTKGDHPGFCTFKQE